MTPANWPALIDITMIFTGSTTTAFAVRRLLANHPEVNTSIVNFHFDGRGQRPTARCPPGGCARLRLTPARKGSGSNASPGCDTHGPYLGGDVTLVDVYANRRAQESLATIPEEQRTLLEQAVRLCGEEVENQLQKLTASYAVKRLFEEHPRVSSPGQHSEFNTSIVKFP